MPKRYKSKRTYFRRYKKKWTPYNTEITIPSPAAQLGSNYALEHAVPCIYGASNSLGNYAAPSDAISAINYYICRVRFKGVIQAAGTDHIILKDVASETRYLLLTIYLCYITFDEQIEYEYPYRNK